MDTIYFPRIENQIKDKDELIERFDRFLHLKPRTNDTYSNSEGALSWVMRGAINYFYDINVNSLGSGNDKGIPSMEIDHFVNNLYRVINVLEELSKLWGIEYEGSSEFKLLEDIRTVIVHSGEQIVNLKSFDLNSYKDIQLGAIHKIGENASDLIMFDIEYDYVLILWADKRKKKEKKSENDVSYERRNEYYKDIQVYFKVEDIKYLIIMEFECFICKLENKQFDMPKLIKLPQELKMDITEELEFDTLERLVCKKLRGGYLIDEGRIDWDGFGLKNLWLHVTKCRCVSKEIREEIQKTISRSLRGYYEAYNDEKLTDDELPSLYIYSVFANYLPDFEKKTYWENPDRLNKIAPSFNVKGYCYETNIGYLTNFVIEVNNHLENNISWENTPSGIICDYVINSIEQKIRHEEINVKVL